MTSTELNNAPKYAMKNRQALEESATCGCYQCLSVMSTQDITDWTDWGNTALCPKCGCDCLIAQSFGIALDKKNLGELNQHWFGKKS
jgi:hypothetical protein